MTLASLEVDRAAEVRVIAVPASETEVVAVVTTRTVAEDESLRTRPSTIHPDLSITVNEFVLKRCYGTYDHRLKVGRRENQKDFC